MIMTNQLKDREIAKGLQKKNRNNMRTRRNSERIPHKSPKCHLNAEKRILPYKRVD